MEAATGTSKEPPGEDAQPRDATARRPAATLGDGSSRQGETAMATEAEKMNTVIQSTHQQIQKLLAEMSKAKDAKAKKNFATLALKEVAKAQKLQLQLNQLLTKDAK
jgi:hypothetical protein